MRERVEELERGDFKSNTPKIDLSIPLIEISINAEESYEGFFSLKSLNFYKMKGVVYTSTYRMLCINPQFFGKEAEIRFRFDASGISEGETIKGFFHIISNGGEFSLPFVVHIQQKVMLSTMGKISNLFHFTNLATKNWKEAFKLFQSPEFKNIFINNDRQYENLYLSLTAGEQITSQCMEEFLTGIHKKSPVGIEVNQYDYEFLKLADDEKQVITITKNTWGYIQMKVKVEGDFIEVNHKVFTSEDFIGNTYHLEYIIRKDKLHCGKNFGRIVISTVNKDLVCNITATEFDCEKRKKERKSNRTKKESLLELVNLYVTYRCKKTNTNPWAKECMEHVNLLTKLEPENYYYKLLRAQLLFIEKKNYEAHEVLEQFEMSKKDMSGNPGLYSYYLYLTTFWNKEKRYVEKTSEEVKRLYAKNKSNWQILWVLLYLDASLQQNIPSMLNKLEEQYHAGCESPILYVEAYRLIKADVFLLSKLGKFELQVLWWAVKNKVLTKEVCFSVVDIATKSKDYNRILFHILSYSYEQFQDKEILSAICGLLIKGNKVNSRYFRWYRLGVEKDIRITRLYEYYMYSIPMNYEENIPKAVLMYFGYNNNLDYQKSALLYERVIKQRDLYPELFQNYRRNIEEFMLQQLLLKRNSEKLAFIYDTMLSLNKLTPELARSISGIIFGCELYCGNTKMKSVSVIHRHFNLEKIYPIVEGRAYINLYSRDYAITFLDEEGNRYLQSVKFQIKNLMDEAYYVKKCFELFSDCIDIKFSISQSIIDSSNILSEHLELLLDLLKEPIIRENYKVNIRNAMIKYYYDHSEDEGLTKYFTELDLGCLDHLHRVKVIELLILKGLYQKAFDGVVRFGFENISVKQLLKLASRLIYLNDFEVNDVLLSMCMHVFRSKKYDEVILKYLIENYNGSMTEMRDIWNASLRFDIESYEIAERLILHVLFTSLHMEEIDDIFEYYYMRGSRFHIAQAFLSYRAHHYLLQDIQMEDKLFAYIIREQEDDGLKNDTCKLAVLKYYSKREQFTTNEEEYIRTTLMEFLKKGMCFKFFERFNTTFLKSFGYEGKYVVEYRGEINKSIFIHYLQEDLAGKGEYCVDEMQQIYPGIYSKAFTLYYGDKVQYYVTETDNKDNLLESNSIMSTMIDLDSTQSRYDLLNDMTVAIQMKDDTTLLEQMKKYTICSEAAESLFKMI